jgi:hypothetical protein
LRLHAKSTISWCLLVLKRIIGRPYATKSPPLDAPLMQRRINAGLRRQGKREQGSLCGRNVMPKSFFILHLSLQRAHASLHLHGVLLPFGRCAMFPARFAPSSPEQDACSYPRTSRACTSRDTIYGLIYWVSHAVASTCATLLSSVL